MTIVNPIEVESYPGRDPQKVKLTGKPFGLRIGGPGMLLEDRLFINSETGKVKAERLIEPERFDDNKPHPNKLKLVLEEDLGKEEAKNLIDKLVKPLRSWHIAHDLNYTEITIWDDQDKEYHYGYDFAGEIDEILAELGINLEHPFPKGPTIKIDTSSR